MQDMFDENGERTALAVLAENIETVTEHRLAASRRWVGRALKLLAGLCVGSAADFKMDVLPVATALVEGGLVLAMVRKEREMMIKTGAIRTAAAQQPGLLLEAGEIVGLYTSDTNVRTGVVRLLEESLAYAQQGNGDESSNIDLPAYPSDAPDVILLDEASSDEGFAEELEDTTESDERAAHLREEAAIAASLIFDRRDDAGRKRLRHRIVESYGAARALMDSFEEQGRPRMTVSSYWERDRHMDALVMHYGIHTKWQTIEELCDTHRTVEDEYRDLVVFGSCDDRMVRRLENEIDIVRASRHRLPWVPEWQHAYSEYTRHMHALSRLLADALAYQQQFLQEFPEVSESPAAMAHGILLSNR